MAATDTVLLKELMAARKNPRNFAVIPGKGESALILSKKPISAGVIKKAREGLDERPRRSSRRKRLLVRRLGDDLRDGRQPAGRPRQAHPGDGPGQGRSVAEGRGEAGRGRRRDRRRDARREPSGQRGPRQIRGAGRRQRRVGEEGRRQGPGRAGEGGEAGRPRCDPAGPAAAPASSGGQEGRRPRARPRRLLPRPPAVPSPRRRPAAPSRRHPPAVPSLRRPRAVPRPRRRPRRRGRRRREASHAGRCR